MCSKIGSVEDLIFENTGLEIQKLNFENLKYVVQLKQKANNEEWMAFNVPFFARIRKASIYFVCYQATFRSALFIYVNKFQVIVSFTFS